MFVVQNGENRINLVPDHNATDQGPDTKTPTIDQLKNTYN